MVRGMAACIFAWPGKGNLERVRQKIWKYRYAVYEDLVPGEDDEKKRVIKLVLKKGCIGVRELQDRHKLCLRLSY